MQATQARPRALDAPSPAPGWPPRSKRGVATRFAALACWACFAGLAPLAALADDADPNALELQVKAAYLYRFAEYVAWPSAAFKDAATPLTIGVMGADDLAAELNRIKSRRTRDDRAVEIRLIKPGESAQGAQMLYVGKIDAAALQRTLESIKARPLLTVSDAPGALAFGSVINFVRIENHIRFEVSVASAQRNGLKVSASLLAVAQRVDGGSP